MLLCLHKDDGEEALRANQQFLSVLSKIKNRDESIYNSEAKLFPDEAEETSDGEAPAAKEKPALLKDVLAQQVSPSTALPHVVMAVP